MLLATFMVLPMSVMMINVYVKMATQGISANTVSLFVWLLITEFKKVKLM